MRNTKNPASSHERYSYINGTLVPATIILPDEDALRDENILQEDLLPKTIPTKNTVDWQIRDHIAPGQGALTHDEIANICQRYNLAFSDLDILSRNLVIALTSSQPPWEIMPELIKKGKKELLIVLKHLKEADERLKNALAVLQTLTFANGDSDPDPADTSVARIASLNATRKEIQKALEFYAEKGAQELVAYTTTPDARKIPDLRRDMICNMLFSFWLALGRRLTYTTNPVENSKREGELFLFINDVVKYLSEGTQTLGGEMLKARLKVFMKKMDQPAARFRI